MIRIRVRRPRHSTVVAYLSLLVALGGTSYAALNLPKNSVGPKQLRKNAVRSSKVKNGSLLAQDFKAGQLPGGPAGPLGPTGPQGLQGLQGPSNGPAGGVLAGSYPTPTFETGVNGLVPIAVVLVGSGGNVASEVHRAPITGVPTVEHSSGRGSYRFDFPGYFAGGNDAVVCTRRDDLGGIGTATPAANGGDMRIDTSNSTGAPADAAFQCAVYDL
jgi:hypothetical protein